MKSDPEMTDLVEALRADLPSAEDSARVKARLAALGVLGASATAGTTAAAGTAAGTALAAQAAVASVGVVARVGALSWSAKLGIAAAVTAGVGGGSVAALRTQSKAEVAVITPAPVTRPAASAAIAARAPMPPRAAVVESEAPAAQEAVTAVAAAPRIKPAAPSNARLANAEPVRATETVTAMNTPPDAPSTQGFPSEAVAVPPTTTTLREETGLVDAALLAIKAGDRERARALLAEHANKFPNGLLRLERERARSKLEALQSGQH